MTDPATVDALLTEIDERVGIERLRALHVNDAAAPLGSNRDRHANIGEGLLGDGLSVLLGHTLVQALPAILETPGPDGHGPGAADIDKLRRLHDRALALAGSETSDSRGSVRIPLDPQPPSQSGHRGAWARVRVRAPR